jgi:hypothetical protein
LDTLNASYYSLSDRYLCCLAVWSRYETDDLRRGACVLIANVRNELELANLYATMQSKPWKERQRTHDARVAGLQ